MATLFATTGVIGANSSSSMSSSSLTREAHDSVAKPMHRLLEFGINSKFSTDAPSVAVVSNNCSEVVSGTSLSMKAVPKLTVSDESSTNEVATEVAAWCRELMPARSTSRDADT
jgi:flagellar capping protein FliD